MCFLAVSTIECNSRNVSAPESERNVQEFFSLIFSLRIPHSLPLLSDGIIGSSRKLKMQSRHLINPFLRFSNFLPKLLIFVLSRLSKRSVYDVLEITAERMEFLSLWLQRLVASHSQVHARHLQETRHNQCSSWEYLHYFVFHALLARRSAAVAGILLGVLVFRQAFCQLGDCLVLLAYLTI